MEEDLRDGVPAPRGVLVTGASKGIGSAIASAFAARGDRVAIHYRGSAEAAHDLAARLGEGHFAIGADLSDPEAVRTMVDQAVAQLGRLDVLVNNAGVYLDHPPLATDYQSWQRAWHHLIDVNLIGPANVTWCALRHLGPGGRIVNISSRGAFRGEPTAPAYGASKAGLNAFGQSLARALGERGISVTAVAPGFVDTDWMAEQNPPPADVAVKAQSPFNRVAKPEEVAAAVLWLASPEAEFASGAILDLNGASYLRT